MTLSLAFDFEDAELLFHTGMSSAKFRTEEQSGRFDTGRKGSEQMLPEMSIASPAYDSGSLLWCATIGDALLLSKIHLAAGFETTLLVDNYADHPFEAYVVLTSWDMHENETPLGPEPVLVEVLSHGHEGESAEVLQAGITRELSTKTEVEVLGKPTVDDHGDHFHVTLIAKMPGERIEEFLTEVSQSLECPLGYNIVSEA